MKYLTVAILATGLFIACNQAGNNTTKETLIADANAPAGGVVQNEFEEPVPPAPLPGPQKTVHYNEPAPVPADWDKQVIRNAEIRFEVKNAAGTNKAVMEAVRGAGGYIATATEVQLAGEIKHDMTIRVPREKFDDLLLSLSGFADSLLQKNITSQDVTAEYIDTKARIVAKEKVKEQYYSFLKQAKNIEEVLKVQDGIGDLQEEIETATGRVNYIRHQSALSTIQLSFFEPLPAPVITPEDAPGFGKEIISAAANGWELIKLLLIGLVKIWPLWVAAGLIVWAVKRRAISRPKNTNAIVK